MSNKTAAEILADILARRHKRPLKNKSGGITLEKLKEAFNAIDEEQKAIDDFDRAMDVTN